MTRIACVLVLVVGAALPTRAQIDPAPRIKRVALVIGNGNYGGGVKNLTSTVADATAIRDKLQSLNFDVISKMNVNIADFDTLMTQFETKLADADQALFYYAGHGAQAENRNYIIPVGTGPITPDNISANSINVARVYTALGESNSRFNLIILDACRNNPLLENGNVPDGRCGGWDCGLAKPIGAPAGTIVAFSTAPDDVALDVGPGGVYSPYTEALLKYMGRPGLPILELFMLVRLKVREDIATQVPWENTSQETPFMFRDPAFIEVTFDRADDDATVLVNGQSVQWTVDDRRKRLIALEPGNNVLRVSAYNQKTRRGIIGPREGWGYRVSIQPHNERVNPLWLEAGETGVTDRRTVAQAAADLLGAAFGGGLDLSTGNVRIPEPPAEPGESPVPDAHWGRGFATAEVRVHVHEDTGAITFPVVDDQVWKDGFSLADPLRTALDRGIAWAVAHEGVRLFDAAVPGSLRPVAELRNELASRHIFVAGRVNSRSHQDALDSIRNTSDEELLEAIELTRRAERNARGQFVEDLRWALRAAPEIRAAVAAGDFDSARRKFSAIQAHDPNVRNELALLSNGELATLVQNIP